MAFGGDPQYNVRYDEAARPFILGNAIGAAYPPQPHLVYPQLTYPGHFHGGRNISSSNNGRSGHGRGRRRCWPWVVGALLLTVVVACGTVFGLLFALKQFNSSLLCSGVSADVVTQNRHAGCVPCPEQVEASGHKCCFVDKDTEQQKPDNPVITEIIQHSETGREDCGALFFLHAVNGEVNAEKSKDFVVIRGWNSKYQHSCIAYNSDTGEFTVNNPGFYIVYDHLAFEWKERGTRSNIIKQQIQAKHLEGTVYGKNYTLASDMRAIQKDDPLVGYIPSYNSRVMTVVYLRKGAVLTIEAQPIELLMVSNSYSSFGLFKL